MANSADPDQTAPKEQSDLGLHYLSKPLYPIFKVIPVATPVADLLMYSVASSMTV